MNSAAYARRQSFIKRSPTVITEESVTDASRTFRASVQRLDPRITEESLPARNGD